MRLEEKLKAIASAIRSKTKKEEKLGLDDMRNGIDEVYEVGYNAGHTDGYIEGYDVGVLGSYNFDATSVIKRDVSEFNNETLEQIGAYAFAGCNNLTTVSLPRTTHVMAHAFDCSNSEIVYDNYDGYDTEIVNPSSTLESLYLPNLTTVGDFAFYCCFNLKQLDLPLLKEIGKKAFGCCGVSSVYMPLAESIGDYAFVGIYKKWGYSEDEEMYRAIHYATNTLQSVNFPKAVSVGKEAFAYNKALTDVSLPVATIIGELAFGSCEGLTSITLPVAKTLGNNAFNNCTNLKNASLPLVEKGGYGAFMMCEKLESVYLPKLVELGSSAFYYCSSLTSIDIPEVKSIGSYAFYECLKIKEMKCPKLEQVDNYSFRDCGIEKVDFTNLKTIRDYGFYYCSSLKALILRGETVVKLSSTGAFNGTKIKNGSGYIYVPRSLLSSYKSATNWSTFSSQFRALEDYTADGTITGILNIS